MYSYSESLEKTKKKMEGKKLYGVIENHQGEGWSESERNGMIELMKQKGQSLFLYSPQSDPLSVRKALGEKRQNMLKSLREKCEKNSICVCVALNVGTEFKGENLETEAHVYVSLVQNINKQTSINTFAFFFDESASSKKGTGEAHCKLVNFVGEKLKTSKLTLLMCPSFNHGEIPSKQKRKEAYWKCVNKTLNKNVTLLWRGKSAIFSEFPLSYAKSLFQFFEERKIILIESFCSNVRNETSELS